MAWLIFETINFRPRSPATVLDFGERIVETRNELAASEQSEFQAAANKPVRAMSNSTRAAMMKSNGVWQ